MSSSKYKLAEKAAALQQKMVGELTGLVKTIERCEKTITELKTELEGVQAKYQTRKTTQQEIAYLTDLLKCANKKLGWEKQLASLQKRTPAILEQLTTLMNDPANPPTEEMREAMLRALQAVKVAIERLERIKEG
jgi:phosphoglycerate-specific signal transduction histidine kinase